MIAKRVILVSVLMAAGFSAPAPADMLRDVLFVDRGGAHVWIALDATPSALAADASPGNLTAQLAGVEAVQSRQITPVGGAPLRQVRIEPASGGARLVIEGDFTTAAAELRQGGVWIALDGAASRPGALSAGNSRGPSQGAPAAEAPQQSAQAAAAARTGAEASSGMSAPTGTPAPANGSVTPARSAPADRTGEGPGAGPSGNGESPGDPPAERASEASPVQTPPEAGVAADPDQPGPCDATAGAVQASPWDLDALTRHADCLFGLGARDNAAGLYERVLAFDPTHFRAAIGLARIREAQGRGDEAARLYERAASAAMTDGEALAARAAADRNRDDDGQR